MNDEFPFAVDEFKASAAIDFTAVWFADVRDEIDVRVLLPSL